MKRIITYGTFDLLHYGHINLLRRAKELGDYLVVALSTDEFNWNSKHKKCYFSYEKRKQLLEAVRYVDLVIPEENWDQKIEDIRLYRIDTFVMGDDWKDKFDFLLNSSISALQNFDLIIHFNTSPVTKKDHPYSSIIKKCSAPVDPYIEMYQLSCRLTKTSYNIISRITILFFKFWT